MSFTPSDFRTTMARFASGVTVVTTVYHETYFGLTVNAFCSVSLTPPLILVSLDLKSQTYASIVQSGMFAVNILAQEQEALALRFARKDLASKPFDDLALRIGETGVPLFTTALARIECRVAQEYPGGDHALLLGEVISVEVGDESLEQEPLLYYRSSFWVNRQAKAASEQSLLRERVDAQKREVRKAADDQGSLPRIELVPLPFLFSFEL
jgi:flavin reductase (DIM6/NTAB) family NADH-FMN oxidoreductase RutF